MERNRRARKTAEPDRGTRAGAAVESGLIAHDSLRVEPYATPLKVTALD